MKLIEIDDGLWIQPHKVSAVKTSQLEKNKCTIFMAGQSAVDGGFLIDRNIDRVVDDLNEVLESED